MLTMESVEPTLRERTSVKDENQSVDESVLSSKPLHRFVKTQPRALGIAIIIFGCAELLMGFPLTGQTLFTSSKIYIPFWQGVLFLVSGSLSIYTEIHPSKKMVTACLALYVVSLLGIMVSAIYRIISLSRDRYFYYWHWMNQWESGTLHQIMAVESILVSCSLCVFVLLIILIITARLALKSSHTQVIIRHIPAPQRDTSSN
ncbi:uncharacterized protein LOC141793598 [Halichoeres trimaculatus]|uniref:uncharacterized protein LOC141793598 n=1 Tax=Halichoeres trimaculatus TaxID=147232 RepID=UPI003D9EA5BA